MKNKKKIIIIISTIFIILIGGIITTMIIINNQNKQNEENVSTEDNSNNAFNIDINLKDSNVPEGEEYTINSFYDENELPAGVEVRFESEEMANYKEPGEYTIKLIFKNSDGKEVTKETKLVINKKDSEEENNNESSKETTNENTKSNSNKSSKTNSSSNNKSSASSSNNSSVASDNVIVKRALSKVGSTGLLCTQLVDYAIQGVGKTLWIEEKEEIVTWCSNIGNLGCKNESEINKEYVFVQDLDAEMSSYLGYSKIRYYAKNNTIYKEEIFKDGEWVEANLYYDKTLFKKKTSTSGQKSLSTENVSKIATQVSQSNIQPGDILYYSNNGKGQKHVAIYIGNGEAVHGGYGSNNSVVRISAYPSYASTPTVWRLK